MKAYTDIKQSAQLALLLPTGSADMWWSKNFLYYNPTACVEMIYKLKEKDLI